MTDDDVRKKEEGLRRAIFRDGQVWAKVNAQPEVAQVGGMHNFTLHFCTNRFVFIR